MEKRRSIDGTTMSVDSASRELEVLERLSELELNTKGFQWATYGWTPTLPSPDLSEAVDAVKRRSIDGVVMSLDVASNEYGLPEKAVRQLVARKRIPYRKLGARILFLRRELDEFFDRLPGVRLEEARREVRR